MWQFGALLYMLCTGFPLFTTDNQENVRDEELREIAAWDDNVKAAKMAIIGTSCPRRLISKLLSKDPFDRPHSWSYVIKQLKSQNTVSTSNVIDIRACSVYHLSEVIQ